MQPKSNAARPRHSFIAILLVLASSCVAANPSNRELRDAVQRNDTEAAFRALEAGANPDQLDADGLPLFARAMIANNDDLLVGLFESGLDQRAKDLALAQAASQANPQRVALLLELGASARYRDPLSGRTALHAAAASPGPQTASVLLEAGADPNAADTEGNTPLLIAARDGYVHTASALLKAGAEPNHRNALGQSAMTWATARKDEDLITALRATGAGEETAGGTVDDLKQAGRDLARGGLVVSTTDLLTDGRHIKIRGRVHNRHSEPVDGIRYIVRLLAPGSLRELDRFREESSAKLEPGGSAALRIDLASTYAGGNFQFVVEAHPIQLGDKALEPPPGW